MRLFEAVGEGVVLGDGLRVGFGVAVSFGVGVSSGVGEGDSDGDAVSVGDSSGVGLGEGLGLSVGDGFGVGVGVRVAVGRGDVDFFGFGDSSGLGEGVGERFREAEEEDELFDFFRGGGVLVKKSFILPNNPSSAARALMSKPTPSATTMKIAKILFMRCAPPSGRKLLQDRFVHANSGFHIFDREILVRRMRPAIRQCQTHE